MGTGASLAALDSVRKLQTALHELCGVGWRSPCRATCSADFTPHNSSVRGLAPSAGIDFIPPCFGRAVPLPDGTPCFEGDRTGAARRARPVTDCSSPERPGASARARLQRGVTSALARRTSRSLLP